MIGPAPAVIPTSRNLAALLLISIVIGGAWLRLSGLGDQSLWIDEGYTVTAAAAILERGVPVLDSGLPYPDWRIPNYLAAASMAAFGFDPFSPWSARLPSALMGIALILAVFLLARSLFPRTGIAYAAAFLTAFSQWEIAWSGQARGYAAAALFITLALWCAWEFLGTWRVRFLAGAGVAGLLAWFTSALSLLALPGAAFFAAADGLARLRLVERLGPARFGILLVGLMLAALALFETAVRVTALSTEGFPAQYLRFLAKEQGIFTAGALAAGALGLFDSRRSRPVLFAFLALAVPVLFVAAYSPMVQFRYLFPFFPLALILLSYAAFRGAELATAAFARRPGGPPLMGAAAALAILVALPHLQFLPAARTLEYGSPQPDFAAAFESIRDRRGPDDLIMSPYAHLHAIYLGEKGLWMPMSLTGKPIEVVRARALGTDQYVGAPMLKDQAQLMDLLDSGQGFIILDRMARIRLPEEAALIEAHPRAREIFRSGAGLDELRLYEFGHGDSI